MRIKNQDDLLDIKVRKAVIEDIKGQENRRRKDEAYMAYQCYKDQTARYVRELLIKQFDPDTVNEMEYAVSNISFIRKVVDKLARVYKYGVDREIWEDDTQLDDATAALMAIADEVDADRKFKKCNRYFKLFKNTVMYVRPKPIDDEGEKQTIKIDPLPPYLYDVVEMEDERERPMAFILSDYNPQQTVGNPVNPTLAVQPGTTGRDGKVITAKIFKGDGRDQTIADTPGDEESKGYVFWTDKYHFTCNGKGEIISDGDIENPIGHMPFVNYAEDQDGSFWAIGGDDLVSGGILVNSMITNVNHIAISQGYGQLVVSGNELPRNIKTGPNKAVILPQQEGDPAPSFEYKNSNPPLDQLRGLVEMYVALLLTTNNLSTSGVQSNLNGTTAFPSGIAMMIDKAESMEDVEDQRQIFTDNEPLVWELFAKWHSLLKSRDELPESLAQYELPEEFDLRVKYGQPKAIESEKERLEVLKMKKDLGIISAIDMLKSEFPDLSDEEAEAKLADILEEKMQRASIMIGGQEREDSEQQNDEQRDERDDRPRDSDEDQRGDEG